MKSLDRLFELLPYGFIGLFARVIAGLIFFRSGLTKIEPATLSVRPATFFLFEQEYKFRLFHYFGWSGVDLPFPAPHVLAHTATGLELLMPLLLWAGFGTRIAAMFLVLQTCVIETVYPEAYVDHALWAIALLMLMRFGPGPISVDHWLWREREAA